MLKNTYKTEVKISRLFSTLGLAAVCLFPFNYASAFEVGIHSHFRRYSQPSDYYLQEIRDLGFNSFRSDYLWEGMEEKKGVLEVSPSLRREDAAFNNGEKYGLSALAVLAYGNRQYDPSGYPTTPEAIKAYANYAYWSASRLKGKVKYYEVWNEWVNGTGIQTRPLKVPPPQVFVELVKQASIAIKRADPNAIVVAGSISPFSKRDMDWFNQVLSLGVLKYLDGVSIHPYSYKDGNYKLRSAEGNLAGIDAFETKLSKLAGHSVPIYITENGIPTYTGDGGLSGDEVAQYVIKYTLLAKTRSYIKGVWWYDLIDDGKSDHVNEDRFGFYAQGGKPKPAAGYYQKIADIAKNYQVQQYKVDNNGIVNITLKSPEGMYALLRWQEIIPQKASMIDRGLSKLKSSGAASSAGDVMLIESKDSTAAVRNDGVPLLIRSTEPIKLQ
ncbi:glycoside hydrolase family 5 protein [Serratia quinivorans]|uniref:glycoside hydrolase family 5 protein n=1 Tax=Serratia quinivorans TaxID=137545 RepID=UPI00217AE3A6|nr:glycoside hydrolase family 5 protein [Serratia quinivorans]CAI0763127.1 Beta-xylosidase [Serratia quinivorans]CAI1563711.1 Beta-xylosidase [Serratia quinivorans]